MGSYNQLYYLNLKLSITKLKAQTLSQPGRQAGRSAKKKKKKEKKKELIEEAIQCVLVLRKWPGSVQSRGVKGQVATTGRTKETGN